MCVHRTVVMVTNKIKTINPLLDGFMKYQTLVKVADSNIDEEVRLEVNGYMRLIAWLKRSNKKIRVLLTLFVKN